MAIFVFGPLVYDYGIYMEGFQHHQSLVIDGEVRIIQRLSHIL